MMHTVAILAQVSAGWHAGKKAVMCPGVLVPAVSWVGFNKYFPKNGTQMWLVLALCIGSGLHPDRPVGAGINAGKGLLNPVRAAQRVPGKK
ncbi:hypothetical protein [Heyndrickxia coagulans]|uniref:hypothetical protein n=1 Tax=Heyndrickxia coagulans TaxID=1398 RepID=UPI00105D7103|nr:hypothetical protein [Heyndrickxia coagulans]MBF8418826.1 hypothetical protein [Heyndrickxia coagulans]